MPKRNRSNELRKTTGYAVPVATVESDQARAARLFAESVRQHEVADQNARERKAAAVEHERRHQELLAAKASAADTIKRLRENGRPREKMAEADAAYRMALAALTEFETGERPHWAPPVPVVEIESADDVEGAETDDASEDVAEDQPE